MTHRRIWICLLVMLLLCGCASPAVDSDQQVTFYYVQSEIDFQGQNGVIAPEIREIGNRSDDLSYLLSLYLQGPQSDALRSPFPENLTLVQIRQEEAYLEVVVSQRLSNLTGMELTLACSCLAKTCMDLSGAQEVRISAQEQLLDGASYITITADSILLSGA